MKNLSLRLQLLAWPSSSLCLKEETRRSYLDWWNIKKKVNDETCTWGCTLWGYAGGGVSLSALQRSVQWGQKCTSWWNTRWRWLTNYTPRFLRKNIFMHVFNSCIWQITLHQHKFFADAYRFAKYTNQTSLCQCQQTVEEECYYGMGVDNDRHWFMFITDMRKLHQGCCCQRGKRVFGFQNANVYKWLPNSQEVSWDYNTPYKHVWTALRREAVPRVALKLGIWEECVSNMLLRSAPQSLL